MEFGAQEEQSARPHVEPAFFPVNTNEHVLLARRALHAVQVARSKVRWQEK